ncbi:MAG: ABC transporter substrate-binding protein [Alphaproteobacteria bacterium]|nr:ABC transporter substrate-binding protein [Alphaproteobacteria bacterium]
MPTRRTFLALAFATCAMLSAPATVRAAVDDPGRFVTTMAQQAIQTAASPGLSRDARLDRFRTLFVAAFDMNELGQAVLGPYWRQASPVQQKQFLDLFRELQVLTWAGRFQDYSAVDLTVLGVGQSPDGTVAVESVIARGAGGPPIPVLWRLNKSAEGFKVVDIVVEGVSMAITERKVYFSAMQSLGGKIDGLLDIMRRKIEQLKA